MMIMIDRQNKKNIKNPTLLLNNEAQLEIDTQLALLSSRKLWQILELNKIGACALHKDFIEEVEKELLARNDFDEGVAWKAPH